MVTSFTFIDGIRPFPERPQQGQMRRRGKGPPSPLPVAPQGRTPPSVLRETIKGRQATTVGVTLSNNRRSPLFYTWIAKSLPCNTRFHPPPPKIEALEPRRAISHSGRYISRPNLKTLPETLLDPSTTILYAYHIHRIAPDAREGT